MKALAYFDDGDLPSLAAPVREYLLEQATGIGPIPKFVRVSAELAPRSVEPHTLPA